MIGPRGLASNSFRACVAAVFLLAGNVRAAPPSETGPAYGVEPGEAPKNSVPVGNAAPTAQPPPAAQSAPDPSTTAPPPSGAGQPGTTTATEVSDNDPRALSDFKPQLDPYGKWVEDPKYGLVWVPDRAVVGEGFSPYVTSGHWALDTAGNWVWVSDFPFGEIVFHYGRWAWTSAYGWSWVPGYQYAPAWVVWRVPTASYSYVGWAPAPPYFVWWGGIGMSLWWGPPYYWVFCPSHYVFAHYPAYYVVHDRGFVHTLAGSTRRYAPAPHASTSSPPIQAARVPSASLPSTRVPAATSRLAGSDWGRANPSRPTSSSTSRAPRPQIEGPPLARDVPFSSPRSSPSRTFSPARPPSFESYRAPPRTFAPGPRPYSVAPRPFTAPPSSYSAPSRVFVPPARTYSPPAHFSAPSRVYSPPARMYSPSPRGFSAPSVSRPSYHAPSSPSFSAPRMHAPMSPGGGARHR